LSATAWPDNINGLQRAIYRAVTLCEGDSLRESDFPQILMAIDPDGARARIVCALAGPAGAARAGSGAVAIARQSYREPEAMAAHVDDSAARRHYDAVGLLKETGELRSLKSVEGDIIRFSLAHYQGQLSEIARRLGIGRSTLYRKLKEYGIATVDNL